jgi:hypothetical protein
VNGRCKPKPKAPKPAPTPAPKPTAPKPTSGGPSCNAGDASFNSEAALRAHLRAIGGGKGYSRTKGGKTVYCGPAGASRPQPQPQPQPQPTPQPQNQCNVALGTALCAGYGYGFDPSVCDCSVPFPVHGGGDEGGNSGGGNNDGGQTCEQGCGGFYGYDNEGFYQCRMEKCGY